LWPQVNKCQIRSSFLIQYTLLLPSPCRFGTLHFLYILFYGRKWRK
jgi:hypothetical protein